MFVACARVGVRELVYEEPALRVQERQPSARCSEEALAPTRRSAMPLETSRPGQRDVWLFPSSFVTRRVRFSCWTAPLTTCVGDFTDRIFLCAEGRAREEQRTERLKFEMDRVLESRPRLYHGFVRALAMRGW